MQNIILDNQIKLYLPSTKDIDKKLTKKEVKTMQDNILQELAEMFGGATVYDAIGSWVSLNGLVLENVKIVQAFCTKEDLQKNIQGVQDLAKELKKTYKQENISLEINNQLTFI